MVPGVCSALQLSMVGGCISLLRAWRAGETMDVDDRCRCSLGIIHRFYSHCYIMPMTLGRITYLCSLSIVYVIGKHRVWCVRRLMSNYGLAASGSQVRVRVRHLEIHQNYHFSHFPLHPMRLVCVRLGNNSNFQSNPKLGYYTPGCPSMFPRCASS